MADVKVIELHSVEELIEFLDYIVSTEEEICLTKSQLHEACDDAWEVWATEKERTRDDKIAVAQFVRVLTGKLFGDDKTEKEEN